MIPHGQVAVIHHTIPHGQAAVTHHMILRGLAAVTHQLTPPVVQVAVTAARAAVTVDMAAMVAVTAVTNQPVLE
jgi:hypothetical protein